MSASSENITSLDPSSDTPSLASAHGDFDYSSYNREPCSFTSKDALTSHSRSVKIKFYASSFETHLSAVIFDLELVSSTDYT